MSTTKQPELFALDLWIIERAINPFAPVSLKYVNLCRALAAKGYLEECAHEIFTTTEKGMVKIKLRKQVYDDRT